jgi:hypothetical protein
VDKHKCKWQKHLSLDLRKDKHTVYIKYPLNQIAPQYILCVQNGKGEKAVCTLWCTNKIPKWHRGKNGAL